MAMASVNWYFASILVSLSGTIKLIFEFFFVVPSGQSGQLLNNICIVSHLFLFQLLKEAAESQRMYELMKQQEVHLKQQVRSI